MENVSEALKIAFGMLIAVLLIVLIVYEFNAVSGLENAKQDKELQEETSEFNKKFSAFDRTLMYGTDIISIIGMAISNNKIYNQEYHANPLGNYDENSEYSINIEFQLPISINKKTIESKYRMLDKDFDGILEPDYEYENKNIGEGEVVLTGGKNIYHDLKFEGNLYQNQTNSNNAWKEYKAIEDIALNGDIKSKTTTRQVGVWLIVRTEDLTGYNELKSIIYKCVDVKYNQIGRIYYMKFESVK